MFKVGVLNIKGGTAKSTTVLNLGACLATSKRRVLLLDFDAQRSLSFALDQDGATPTIVDWLQRPSVQATRTNQRNLHLLPGDLRLGQTQFQGQEFREALTKLEGYQIGLIDCAPGLNLVSLQATMSCDRLLIPVICEPAVLKGVTETIQLVRQTHRALPIDLVRVRHRHRLAMVQACENLLVEAANEWQYHLFKTTIPDSIVVAEAIAHHRPLSTYAPRSSAAITYKKLAKECLGVWK